MLNFIYGGKRYERKRKKRMPKCKMWIPKDAKVCPYCRAKQNGKLKWIITAVVVLYFIIVLFGGESESDVTVTKNDRVNETSYSSEPETIVEEPVKIEQDFVTVGDYFEVDGLKVSVNDASSDFRDYKNDYGWNTPEQGMKYIMVSFTFENHGDSDKYVSIYDFDCYADNSVCEQQYGLDDSDFMNASLSPGRNVSFKTYYAVPVGSETIELEYEANFWTEEKVIIKIQ